MMRRFKLRFYDFLETATIKADKALWRVFAFLSRGVGVVSKWAMWKAIEIDGPLGLDDGAQQPEQEDFQK